MNFRVRRADVKREYRLAFSNLQMEGEINQQQPPAELKLNKLCLVFCLSPQAKILHVAACLIL